MRLINKHAQSQHLQHLPPMHQLQMENILALEELHMVQYLVGNIQSSRCYYSLVHWRQIPQKVKRRRCRYIQYQMIHVIRVKETAVTHRSCGA